MDFCCGSTMIARLSPLYTEGGALIADVPFLFCHTCGHMTIAPTVEFDVTMYTHYCETDGVKKASLFDVVERERIQAILEEYPAPPSMDHPWVGDDQFDHMLDLWNFAAQIGDQEWIDEIKRTLVLLHRVRSSQTRTLQEQP